MIDTFTRLLDSLTANKLMLIAAIIAVTLILISLSQRLLPRWAEWLPRQARPYMRASVPILRLLLLFGAGLLILTQVVEPSLRNLIALLGALGVALGFALKDYASSLLAGIVSLYEMPYQPGDWIRINDIYGRVRRIDMRAVKLVTPDDTVITVPHLKLWDQLIHNANNGSQQLQCVTEFHLHPDHDAVRVRELLNDIALTSPYLQLDRPIAVIVEEKPWGTVYRLKAYPVDPDDQFLFISDLSVRGKAALRGMGVEFSAALSTPEQTTDA